MEWTEIKKFEGREVNIILDNGRVYSCKLKYIFPVNKEGISMIQAYDKKDMLIQFNSDKVQAIEVKE
jgi:hypothetical protein